MISHSPIVPFSVALPIPYRIIKHLRQFICIGWTGRELCDAVLGQGTFDQGRDVLAAVTNGGKAVGHLQFLHKCDDAVSQNLSRIGFDF